MNIDKDSSEYHVLCHVLMRSMNVKMFSENITKYGTKYTTTETGQTIIDLVYTQNWMLHQDAELIVELLGGLLKSINDEVV